MEGLKMAASSPWILAIEALLHMQQVDLSIILKLIESAPDVSDELGGNTRELLAIRVLENLYDLEVENKNGSVLPPGLLTKIDDSLFCEEVVNRILQVESPEDLRFDVAHISELDVPSFISEKRAGLQNCHLHQLKIEILEGSNPVLKSLKDVSGLEVPNENSRIPVDGSISNGIADEHGEHKRKLASLTAEDAENSEENLPAKHLPPGNRDRNISVARNCEVASAGPCGTFKESEKKVKFDFSCSPQKTHDLSGSACQHELLGDSSSRTVEHIDEPVASETGPEVNPMEESKVKENHCADASSRLKSNNDMNPSVVLQRQQLVPYASTPDDISREDDAHVNFSDKATGDNQCSLEPPAVTVNANFENEEENGSTESNDTISENFQNNVDQANSKENDVHGDNLELSSDCDEYHDVRADLDMSKNSFLSSQGMNTQDSLGTQLSICVKCNKDGKLLVCSSSSCPLVVHEECLGSAIDLDRMRKFYCPFCAYSRAISHYLEAKKNFSLTRTELRAFLEFRAELEEKSSSKRLHVSKKHGSGETQNTNKIKNIEPTNNHDFVNEDIGPLRSSSKLAGQVEEPSKTGTRVETSFDENEKSCSRDQEMIIPESTTRNRMRVKKELVCQSDCDTNGEESSNAGSEKCDASRYCIRPRKEGRHIMDPIAQVSAQMRRKKVPWTNVEEQTLKEGVRRFACEDDKIIPWKQIWEFGADVFEHRRNPGDLKDKWRNMCKRSPKK